MGTTPVGHLRRDITAPPNLRIPSSHSARGTVSCPADPWIQASLARGHIGGLARDASSDEPPTDHALLRHPLVIATPHVGGYTRTSVDRAMNLAIDILFRVLGQQAAQRTTSTVIATKQKDSALLANLLTPPDDCAEPSLWWLGQSGSLVRCDAQYAVVAPYLSDSLTANYAGSDRPNLRLTERYIDPARLGFVNLAFSTYGHTNHFDQATLRAIAGAENRTERLRLVLPAANLDRASAMLTDLDVELVGVRCGQEISSNVYVTTALLAAHPEITCDAVGNDLYLSFAIRVGGWTVYHGGDTLWREPVVSAAAAACPEIALVPINRNDPARGVAGNLNGEEAANLAHAIGARLAIPHRYAMFAFNTASPEKFEDRCRKLKLSHRNMRCGERFDFSEIW